MNDQDVCFNEEPEMGSLRILESVQRSDVGDWNEINTSLLAIKDELMRVMPDRLDGLNSMNKGELYVRGSNDCRSQMISAITKLCEEGKCTN